MYNYNSCDLYLPKLRQFFARKRSFFYFLMEAIAPLHPQLVHLCTSTRIQNNYKKVFQDYLILQVCPRLLETTLGLLGTLIFLCRYENGFE